MPLMRIMLAACLGLCMMPALAAPPNFVSLHYGLYKRGFLVAEIEERYENTAGRYVLNSITRPHGLLALLKPEVIEVRSQGRVSEDGLQPEQFDQQRELEPERNSSARFDWTQQRLALNHHGISETLPLVAGTQDRLSAMYQFMFLKDGVRTLDFPLTNGATLVDYRYRIQLQTQTLSTPAGDFRVRYLDEPADAGARRTEIWLAENLYNLPCKVVITEADGGQLTQLLERAEIR